MQSKPKKVNRAMYLWRLTNNPLPLPFGITVKGCIICTFFLFEIIDGYNLVSYQNEGQSQHTTAVLNLYTGEMMEIPRHCRLS
jgi:hypothetical protein